MLIAWREDHLQKGVCENEYHKIESITLLWAQGVILCLCESVNGGLSVLWNLAWDIWETVLSQSKQNFNLCSNFWINPWVNNAFLNYISFWNTLCVPFEVFIAIVLFQLYEDSKGSKKIVGVAVLYIPLIFCLESVIYSLFKIGIG